MGKKKGFKNILMPPFGIEWPKVDKDTEDKIITALTLKLQEFPSLESKRTKDARRKSGQPDSDSTSQPEQSPEESDKLRARLRQQLVIGHRQVTKALERNLLALVLVSNDAQPTILLRSLLPLVASRRCPGICFSNLSQQLTEAVGVTSILALGFKKSQPDEPNDFEEFVSMAAALAPPLSVPWASQEDTGGSTDVDGGDGVEAEENRSSAESVGQEEDTADETSSPAGDGLLMAPDQEREVLTQLLELLTPYEALFQKPRSKYTPEEIQTRKTINSGVTMDLAAVRSAVCGDQLDLLLVQHEHRDPHPILVSAVKTAVEKGCPVLQMAALKTRLCGVVRNGHLLAVGFKKRQDRPIKPPEKFRQFVTMASQYIPSHLGSSASIQPKESSSREEKRTEPTSKDKRRKQKPPSPVYDVSSLYVYKKDNQNLNSGTETRKKADSTSETYISLSSEPTIQYLGVKPVSVKTSLSDIAFVDSKGIRKQRLTTEKPVETEEPDVLTQTSESVEFEVMGMDSVDAPAVSKSFYHEPRAKKPKANLKRKLDRSAGHGEFVSFKIRPTNIQVSLPNPNKKKHKKFKKK